MKRDQRNFGVGLLGACTDNLPLVFPFLDKTKRIGY